MLDKGGFIAPFFLDIFSGIRLLQLLSISFLLILFLSILLQCQACILYINILSL
jgi:hypothetical protein